MDNKGKVLHSGKSDENRDKIVLNTLNIPDCTYFLHIKEGKKVSKKQVIIKHYIRIAMHENYKSYLIFSFMINISVKYFKKTLILLCVFLFFSSKQFAQNPLIKDIGMSDPHVRIFNDTIWLFSGHDDHPNDKTWVMRDWRVFSSTNLLDWKHESTIYPKDNYMGANSTDCWAGDAAERNGKYYFYFSDQKRSVGVMVADDPAGPYKDALGKPLVAPMHDPTIFIEDDANKTPYLIYGDKAGSYHVAKLNDDMISLAEQPKPISITGEEWEKAELWMDKNYIFKYKDTYYLSWGRDYAISKNIYGPYKCVGKVGEGHNLSSYAHSSFFWWKGQFYHIWTYYLRPGYKYRECIISYCHMSDDGRIVTDTKFLDQHFENGVGQYKTSWPVIQAEWYSEKSEEVTKKGSREDGFKLSNIKNGSWVKFANMDFGDGEQKQKFVANLSKAIGSSKIEIRVDEPLGEILGEVSIMPGSDKIFSGKLKDIKGIRDLYLRFYGNDNMLLDLDSFSFK